MKIGLALGGGGAKGFAHLGVLRVLKDAGIDCDVVAGTSVGALVGVIYASGSIEKFEEYAANISRAELALRLGPSWPVMGLFSGDYIEKILQDFVSERNIEELKKPFAALSVDLKKAEVVTFKEGDLRTAVHASVSIPGLFKPLIYEDKVLVDGGVLESVPVAAARELGARVVIAVDLLSDISNSPDQEDGSWSIMEIVQRSSIIAQRRLNQFRYEKDRPEILIQPRVSHVKVMDFHRGREIIKCGIKAAEEVLPELQGLLNMS
jgi:NTE family protein